MSVEILAPVGGKEQLTAAVRSGADAVYMGTKSFNARRNAENFGGCELTEAIEYCHGRGVKVHIALNTLIKDPELPLLYDEIKIIAENGADAVIVQDLAVLEMLRRHCPSMPVHASTQMAIHNLEGARKARELGFSRVVLARELSIEEIRKISEGTDIELEVFVHGALCMSVSGACYISSMLGERSGNRGLCAQPCRLDFRSQDRRYALSLKDMSHITRINELIDAGVCSLKIEGRMKRPEYVSAAVIACKNAADGGTADLKTLKAVFSRSGFTEGYLTGKRDLEMFGYRTKEDVEASASVLGEIAANYRNELQRIPVDMTLTMRKNEPSSLEVTDGENVITVQSDMPEIARTMGADLDYIKRSLEKTGGTPFYLNKLSAAPDKALMLRQSTLNSMRRQALEELLKKRSKIVPKVFSGGYVPEAASKRETMPKTRVRLEKKDQFHDVFMDADMIYLPLNEIDGDMIGMLGDRLICELPRLVFPMKEERLISRLCELKDMGLKHACAGNLGTMSIARKANLELHGGFDLNILNSVSLRKYESMGLSDTLLSFEININDASRLNASIARGIIGYGYLPLMIFRNCPAKTSMGCKDCTGSSVISDRTGARFKILCSEREYSSMLNHIPLYLGDKNVKGVDFTTLYFTLEDREECGRVWEAYLRGLEYNGSFTRGLYYRKLK